MSEFHQNLDLEKGVELLNTSNLLTLFESINDFIFILNSEAKILDVNPVVLKRLKYSKDELIGNTVLMVHPSDHHETATTIIKDMVEGKREICPIPLLSKDGELIPVETKVIKGTLGQKDVLIGISRDISERKKTENQLKRERDIFENITETSPVGITMVNKNGEITYANLQAENILGLSKDEISQRTYNAPSWKITDFEGNPFPDQQLPFQQVKHLNHPIFDIRHAIEWPNGYKIFLSINAAPFLDEDGNFEGMVATFDNITDKIKIEESLKKEQTRVELYLDLAGVIIVALNKNGEITLLNKKGYDVLEYNDGELIGKNWFDICIPSSLKDRVFKVFNQLMRQEIEPVEFFENQVITKNGKEKIIVWHNVILCDENKKIVGTLSSGEDITERKQAEQKLRESEDKYRSLIDGLSQTGIGIDIVDSNYNIIFQNQFLKDLFGDHQNRKCFEFYLRRENCCEDCPMMKAIQNNKVENAIITAPNNRTYEIISAPLPNPDGTIEQAAEVIIDITDRVISEQKIKESEEKYRTAYNRSNLYKDVFTHDINNILQNILSSLELTKIFSSDPKRRQSFEEVTNLIYEQVIRGKMLVSNVQELSNTDDITSSLFSIEALKVLKDSVESVKNHFTQKVVNIKIYSLQNDYFVRANDLLKDVFRNILINAIQHNTKPFVEIFIKISKENYKGIQFIKFEFLDNGIGIHDSMKQLIFGREYKKEGIPSGIGLGLLLVKKILESYKGEIRVEDNIKGNFTEGSNFIITIPEAI